MSQPDLESNPDGSWNNQAAWMEKDDSGDTYLSVQVNKSTGNINFKLYPSTDRLQKGLNLAHKIKSTIYSDELKELKDSKIGEFL